MVSDHQIDFYEWKTIEWLKMLGYEKDSLLLSEISTSNPVFTSLKTISKFKKMNSDCDNKVQTTTINLGKPGYYIYPPISAIEFIKNFYAGKYPHYEK